MYDIRHLIRIHASPERIYRALTTADGIHGWWTRDADLDDAVGGTGEFRFYGGKGVTVVRIAELDRPRRVGWETVSSNAPGGWVGTTITFDLRADGDDTILTLAHRGFAEPSDGVALVNTGWAYYLVSLQQYLETGEGAPQQDKDFKRVIRQSRPAPSGGLSPGEGSELSARR